MRIELSGEPGHLAFQVLAESPAERVVLAHFEEQLRHGTFCCQGFGTVCDGNQHLGPSRFGFGTMREEMTDSERRRLLGRLQGG